MRRRGRPPTPDILTQREWEVLDLVRAGLTNREIADRLGISLSGAKHHVSEIIGKLGVDSREEAAAWRGVRRVPLIAPIGAFLGHGKPKASVALQAAAIAVVAGFAILALVAVLAGMGDKPTGTAQTASSQEAMSTPNEQQISSAGPYVLGYGAGGGTFLLLEGRKLTLLYQLGQEIEYLIDDDTQFLWAYADAIRYDRNTDGLRGGVSVNVSFDQPVDATSVYTTPVDTVLVGYFQYIRGHVVYLNENYVDIRIDRQLEHLRSVIDMNDGIVRVWLDDGADVIDDTYAQTGPKPGVQASFGGLINAVREPVAYQVRYWN